MSNVKERIRTAAIRSLTACFCLVAIGGALWLRQDTNALSAERIAASARRRDLERRAEAIRIAQRQMETMTAMRWETIVSTKPWDNEPGDGQPETVKIPEELLPYEDIDMGDLDVSLQVRDLSRLHFEMMVRVAWETSSGTDELELRTVRGKWRVN